MPRPEAVIVVGLGAEGELRGTRSRADGAAGRHRVGAADGRAARRRPPLFEIAATLIGSGGIGITRGPGARS